MLLSLFFFQKKTSVRNYKFSCSLASILPATKSSKLPTFSYHFKKNIVHYNKICYNIDVVRQTVCLVVNPTKVNNIAYLFDCTAVGQASD